MTWHDGQPFTSADVAFSALQVWKPLQNLGRVVFKDLEAVDTPDAADGGLPLRQADAVPAHPQRAAGADQRRAQAPLRRHRHRHQPGQHAPVGTGPFRFVEHQPGEFYRLERNADYWGKAALLDEIVYRVLPDRAAAAGALEADEIQLAAFSAVPLADLDRIGKVTGSR